LNPSGAGWTPNHPAPVVLEDEMIQMESFVDEIEKIANLGKVISYGGKVLQGLGKGTRAVGASVSNVGVRGTVKNVARNAVRGASKGIDAGIKPSTARFLKTT